MAKKASSKSTGAAAKPAKAKSAKKSGAKSKAKTVAKRPARARSQGGSDAVRKLLESPLVADLLAVCAKAALALPKAEPFDLILADPPYAAGCGSAAVAAVVSAGWLAPGGWMSVETARGDAVDPGPFEPVVTRNVGRARLTILRRP